MYDIAIIGGGINGCGIARDAAGRGWSVLLAEKGDLAGATSSASSKLIHCGLRYLEQFRFRLVRDSLKEREVLLRMAPHVVEPLHFVLPYRPGLRPALLLRLGLLLYDRIGGRQSLPPSAAVDLSAAPVGRPLKPGFRRGFAYSDCRVDDARLVVLNAMDAAARGSHIRVRTEVVSAQRRSGHWQIGLHDVATGREETVDARTLVNAGGAWVADIAARRVQPNSTLRVRLVKGSHIVVRKLFDHDRAYILQNADARAVFAIPFARDFTLIGTTDVDCTGDPATATVSDSEIAYLCAVANAYFANPIAPSDVVWSYAGVRALHDDGHGSAQDATRDFALVLDGQPGAAPLLSVIGGKITTYRLVAEQALRMLELALPAAGSAWTRDAPLPGGDFASTSREDIASGLAAACPAMGKAAADRIAAGYGTMALAMFAGACGEEQLGIHFGAGLYEREVAHLVENEWARTADDILWRRTKLGLRFSETERTRLSDWIAARHPRFAVLPNSPG